MQVNPDLKFSTIKKNRFVKFKYTFLLDESPYEIGQTVGMEIDTIPEALEKLNIVYKDSKITITPSIRAPERHDLYWANEKGEYIEDFSNEDLKEFEKGIRDWLREWREKFTLGKTTSRQIWPQTGTYWVKIKDPGSTSFTKGAIIPYREFERENQKVIERKEQPASIEVRYRYGIGNGKPNLSQTQFINVGERVKYIGTSRYRYGNWPEGAWLQFGSQGTVIEYYPELPAEPPYSLEPIPAWALIQWDNGGQTAIMADSEGKDWQRLEPIASGKYFPDSAEFVAQTIEATGYQEKLDNVFQEAISRIRR